MKCDRLIIGNGKVTNVIARENDRIITRQECDITIMDNVTSILRSHTPNVVINCAAKTNLEWCEDNKRHAHCVNTQGPINILTACKDIGAKLVHISSGCLFDGNGQISYEDSMLTPSVWYTRTKAWADEYIQNFGYENYLILRPRQLISAIPHPTNMITKFLSRKEFYGIEEQNSFTCIEDLSEMIDHLLDRDEVGVFNCCNEGTMSPYEIACMVRDHLAPDMRVHTISYDDLLSVLPNRRVNTILSIDKLKSIGCHPRPAKEALTWCLKNMNERLK